MNREFWQLKTAASNYYDAYRLTTRISNRLKALDRLGKATDGVGLYDPALGAQLDTAKAGKDESARILRQLYRECAPPAIIKFQSGTIGLGDLLMAQLVGVVGDFKSYTEAWWETTEDSSHLADDSQDGDEDGQDGPPEKRVLVLGETKTAGVRDIWTYCGHGDPAARRRKGGDQADQFKAGSPLAKTITHLMAEFALRKTGEPDKNGRVAAQCPYYPHYLDWKAKAVANHPEWTLMHAHNHATRKVGKAILKDIWRVQHGFAPAYGEQTPWAPRRPLAA